MARSLYPLIQFVETPDVDATVRHDWNPGGEADVPASGLSLGTPSRQGDPGAFNPDWRWRQIQLTQRVNDYKSGALATLSSLEGECLRRTNWLLFRLSEMSPPVWAKTYQSPIGPTAFDTMYSASDDAKTVLSVPVTLDADPWLLGAEESFTATILTTVAGTATEQQIVLPAIKGDFQTPISLAFEPGVGGVVPGKAFVSVAPQETTTLNRWAVTAEASGSSALASAPAAIAPGRYKVLAYQAANVPLRFGWAPDNVLANTVWNDTSEPLDNITAYVPAATWQDLGEVEFAGPIGGTASLTPKIHVQRTSGSGTVNATLMLVTVSDSRVEESARSVEITSSAGGTGPGNQLWIGDDMTMAVLNRVGSDQFRAGVEPKGSSEILVHPQYENILTFLGNSAGGGASTITVTGTYRPRYRSLPSS